MPYKVTKDGLTVGLTRGTQMVRGEQVPVRASVVAAAGTIYQDDDLPEALRKRADEGKVKGLEKVSQEDADKAADEGPSGEGGEGYDPTQHKVDEVLEYLQSADADEVQRVKDAEAASSRNSVQIAEFEQGGDS